MIKIGAFPPDRYRGYSWTNKVHLAQFPEGAVMLCLSGRGRSLNKQVLQLTPTNSCILGVHRLEVVIDNLKTSNPHKEVNLLLYSACEAFLGIS